MIAEYVPPDHQSDNFYDRFMEQRDRTLINPSTTDEYDFFPFPIEPLRSIPSTNKQTRFSTHSNDSGITLHSRSSFPVFFTVNPPCSTAFQNNCALNNAQISKPSITNTLKRTSSTTSNSRLTDQPRGPPPNQPIPRSPSSNLEARVKQLEEEITKARNWAKQFYPFIDPN